MKKEKIAPAIACIIFNCDSILLNTETIIISVLLDKAEEYGLNIELDEAVWLFSEKGIEQNIIHFKNLFGISVSDNFEEEVRKKIDQELRYGLEAKEGVREMLEQLEIPFCVVSDIPREEIEFNLRLTNLLKFFSAEKIFTTCEIVNRAPGTGLYLHVSKIMGYEPEQCAVIVDRITGIRGEVKDGFTIYGLTNGFNKNEMADLDILVLEEIIELPKLLKIV
ncbi:HAD hydrolase-like protein [Flavobacterium sp.]|uniref:HAD hydrolase-like protein n=1 Tax=Flavobacterium sp. TaxID=239 RepID=UPI003D102AE1